MPQTVIVQTEVTLELNDLKDVVVTPIEFDPDSGLYVREWRYFGTPADDQSPNNAQTLVVRAKASTRAALEISTPSLQV